MTSLTCGFFGEFYCSTYLPESRPLGFTSPSPSSKTLPPKPIANGLARRASIVWQGMFRVLSSPSLRSRSTFGRLCGWPEWRPSHACKCVGGVYDDALLPLHYHAPSRSQMRGGVYNDAWPPLHPRHATPLPCKCVGGVYDARPPLHPHHATPLRSQTRGGWVMTTPAPPLPRHPSRSVRGTWGVMFSCMLTPSRSRYLCEPVARAEDQTPAHRGGYDECVELPGRGHDDLADDLRDLRGVRRGGGCVVWHFIGRMSPTSFAHQTRHLLAANFTSTHTVLNIQRSTKNRAPRSSHDDIVATCAICASCVACAKQPNVGTSWWA